MLRDMKKPSEILVAALAAIAVIYIVYFAVASVVFENRFGLNTRIAGVDVSLKNKAEAKVLIEKKTTEYRNSQVEVGNKSYPVSDFVTRYDIDKGINEALVTEKSDIPVFSVLRGKEYSLEGVYSKKGFGKLLRDQYKVWSVVPEDARVDIAKSDIVRAKPGQRLMLPESRLRIQNDLNNLNNKTGFVIAALNPMVTDDTAIELVRQAQDAVAEPLRLTSARGDFEVSTNELQSWLKVMPKTPKTLVAIEPLVKISNEEYFYFDANKVTSYVYQIKAKLDQPKKNAILAFSNGTVQVESKEVIGYQLNVSDATQKIQEATAGNREIVLTINEDLPEVRSNNLSELGITELISTGTSDFRGSPANRVHNFRTGASKFNGVLIKPDEKFSFNTTLGPVEASTGYLPELVILEDKTVPQYGGGLCQVSSTAFRAVLNAGLPVLERRYHAYPVSYYKPYGVDATIYLPKPDLVFKNDTGHYILIQTRISGTKLFFDFYGTKASRTVKFAGNIKGDGAVFPVESVNPGISDAGLRGKGSFTASVYRFIYDESGKWLRTDTFISKYDSPDKYPH